MIVLKNTQPHSLFFGAGGGTAGNLTPYVLKVQFYIARGTPLSEAELKELKLLAPHWIKNPEHDPRIKELNNKADLDNKS